MNYTEHMNVSPDIEAGIVRLAENPLPNARLGWWKRRGEKLLYLSHQNPPAVGTTSRGQLITSVLREKYDTATIIGVAIPCYRVYGKPA